MLETKPTLVSLKMSSNYGVPLVTIPSLQPLLAVLCLLGAAIGGGFFGALQGVLVMTVVPSEVRGRALGLLSMAIGVLPVGMLLLGELAEKIGTRQALAASSASGVVALILWLWRRPEVTRITSG